MEIRRDILSKYLEFAAIEQLEQEYRETGYEKINDFILEGISPDLVMRKGDELLIFEFKVGQWSENKRKEVSVLRNKAVGEFGGKFSLVFVNHPDPPEIIIDNIEAVFHEILPEHLADEFNELSSATMLDEVSNIEFDYLEITSERITMKGSGHATLELQFGSDSDYKRGDGLRSSQGRVFDFHISMDREMNVSDVYELYFIDN